MTDGRNGYFGSGGAITVPYAMAVEVIDKERSLSAVCDDWAGRPDVRNQG
ncbi:MAG: hypothetical protein HYR55_10165 [Acidobacteria bacterium]|nr:hypothetical protein [Acidobacteriota bacterium]MBI3658322.1 hypothetical protein [Acidobacteriota bacterium]